MNNAAEVVFKSLIERIYMDLMPHLSFTKDWAFTPSEWIDVVDILALIKKNEDNEQTVDEIKAYLTSFLTLDCTTLRVIYKGYLVTIDDAEFNFENKQSALELLNKNGVVFPSWDVAYEASEMGEIEKCGQWYNGETGAIGTIRESQRVLKGVIDQARLKRIAFGFE